VERSLAALHAHGNTLGIAPTGSGKTIMLSAVAGQLVGDSAAKACVLAHRDELTAQNREKFGRVNPKITTSVVDAGTKDWAGQATFAMVPTLARAASLAAMPALDLLVVVKHQRVSQLPAPVLRHDRRLHGKSRAQR
jgi:superfamily II DNA or RNA helicase